MMSHTIFRARIITALLLFVAGLVVLWEASDLPLGTLNRIRAGFFPTVFGVLMVILSVLMIVRESWSRKKSVDPKNDAAVDTDSDEGPVNLKGAAIISGIFVLYVLMIDLLGFLAASFVGTVALGYVLGLKNWRLIVLSVGTVLTIWLIFDIWLDLSLPRGMWL